VSALPSEAPRARIIRTLRMLDRPTVESACREAGVTEEEFLQAHQESE
jgi:hypothetical protein